MKKNISELAIHDIKNSAKPDRRVRKNINVKKNPLKELEKPNQKHVYKESLAIYYIFTIVSFCFMLISSTKDWFLGLPDGSFDIIFGWYGGITIMMLIIMIQYSLGGNDGGIIVKIVSAIRGWLNI